MPGPKQTGCRVRLGDGSNEIATSCGNGLRSGVGRRCQSGSGRPTGGELIRDRDKNVDDTIVNDNSNGILKVTHDIADSATGKLASLNKELHQMEVTRRKEADEENAKTHLNDLRERKKNLDEAKAKAAD